MTTNARSVNSRNSIFERNPKVTILFVITISGLILYENKKNSKELKTSYVDSYLDN